MRTTPARIWLAVAATATVLAAAGCSGSPRTVAGKSPAASPSVADLSPVAAVQAAARVTQQTSTVRMEMSSVTRLAGHTSTMTGTGAFDYQRRRGQFDMTIDGGASSLGALTGKAGSKLKVSVIIDGAKSYLGGLPTMPAGAWVESDSGSAMLGNGTMDPTKSLQMLDQMTAGGVRKVGAGQVRGTPVTHYQALIDPSKVVAALGMNKGPQASLAATMRQPIPVDVYIDDQQRIRELDEALDHPMPASLGGGTSHTKLTSQFYDYGAPVHITIPTNVHPLGASTGMS